MKKLIAFLLIAILALGSSQSQARGSETFDFTTVAPDSPQSFPKEYRLRSNLLPWLIAVPNLGAEFVFSKHWSGVLDVWFSPWKITEKYSLKTVAILPEARWWVKSSQKGSFLNIHADVAWFNARVNANRYQDTSRPLFGAGIGYGYHAKINSRWAFEFEIGAGYANMRYDRYFNVANGALRETKDFNYWGIDRLSVAFTYYICDL